MDGEKEYKRMITKIKEIACEFSDDVEKACVPTVLRSIAKRNGQHLKESISVQNTMCRQGMTRTCKWTKAGMTLQRNW